MSKQNNSYKLRSNDGYKRMLQMLRDEAKNPPIPVKKEEDLKLTEDKLFEAFV